mmetsp:Transcript_13390/g.26055  ORF Transcript_13390/g.26055 Transcript_13390/m.26055 type:complete len:216 (-) Transcript_13390:369-1016(-)
MKSWSSRYLAANAHGPDTNATVGVTRVEGLAVGAPAEGDAVVRRSLLANGREVGFQLVHDELGLEVPNLDAGVGRGAKPVAVRREDHRVDDVAALERIQMLALVQVPEHGSAILAARRAQRAIRRHGHRVKVAGVARKVGAQLAVGEVPHLDQLVPAARHNQRVGGRRREPDAADPLSVPILNDSVLALAKGIPQLDRLVARARHNLTIIRRECH